MVIHRKTAKKREGSVGFWDFIAPDYDSFVERLGPWVPAQVMLGKVGLSGEQLLSLAWLSPASAAGLASRTAYSFQTSPGGVQQDAWNAIGSLFDNLSRGGQYTPQPGSPGTDLTEALGVPPIVLANTYEATIRAQSGGRAIDNVLHFTGTGSGQEQACCTALQTAWKLGTGPLKQWDNKVALVSFQVVDLSSTSGGIYTIPDTSVGTRTAASIATRGSCALVQYNGLTRNRSSRGRTYFGPLYEPDVDVDGASLASGVAATILGYWNAMRTSMSTAGFTQCVVSRKLVASYAITFIRVQPTMATQRRRIRA